MIMTVEELRMYIDTDKSDALLQMKLDAIETAIRGFTNNNFQNRKHRRTGDIIGDLIVLEALSPFKAGSTIQVTESQHNDGLYVITEADESTLQVDHQLIPEKDVLITEVVYPADIKAGVVKMIEWELENGNKAGIQSETISRHSVTYYNMDGENSVIGFPKSLTGFLQPYRKARF